MQRPSSGTNCCDHLSLDLSLVFENSGMWLTLSHMAAQNWSSQIVFCWLLGMDLRLLYAHSSTTVSTSLRPYTHSATEYWTPCTELLFVVTARKYFGFFLLLLFFLPSIVNDPSHTNYLDSNSGFRVRFWIQELSRRLLWLLRCNFELLRTEASLSEIRIRYVRLERDSIYLIGSI